MNTPYLDDLIADKQLRAQYAFIIRLMTRDYWYMFDVDTNIVPHPVLWTQHMKQAFWFNDERSVEEFKADFLNGRKVEILRIERNGV